MYGVFQKKLQMSTVSLRVIIGIIIGAIFKAVFMGELQLFLYYCHYLMEIFQFQHKNYQFY